ncbi:MAG: YceI family protein [Melioribacteraceae bacterium]|nr:YceI family protein [Melioribacteraceae bacterium]MCF8353005.1 YceI family protein [Melioribacteraceae bacterium]MCF8392896.1 YceI family protein [Melioribacteraceae bacterium]MCF8417810.1 YceI family protein [Melioribacteraceae bacterium]
MKALKLIAILVVFSSVSVFGQTKWNVDPSHSSVKFSVTHMLITNVTGNFKSYNGEVTTDGDDWSTAKVSFSVDINSIDTDNEKRDEHLKSDDFFNAAEFPEMTFESTKMEKVDEDSYKLHGLLQIRNFKKEVTFDVEFGGMINDPWGNTRVGFDATTEINRFDFGLKWDNTIETGGLVVSKDVEINVNLQLIKEK